MTKQEFNNYLDGLTSEIGFDLTKEQKAFAYEAAKEYHKQALRIHDVSGSLRSNAINFTKWTQHLDNGTEHYNPHTKEKSESIGFSPCDCLVDEIYTVEELYDKWKELGNEV